MFSCSKKMGATIFVAVMLLGCGDGQSTQEPPTLEISQEGLTETISLDATEIEVSVPANAVSSAVTLEFDAISDDTIEEIFPNSIDQPVLALNLEPTGQQFSEPITLSFDAPADVQEGDTLFTLLESEGDYELLPAEVVNSPTGLKVSVAISHFSSVIIGRALSFSLTVPETLEVGESGEAVLQADVLDRGVTLALGSEMLDTQGPLSAPTASDSFIDAAFRVLNGSRRFTETVVCSSEGAYSIDVTLRVSLQISEESREILAGLNGGDVVSDSILETVSYSASGQCIAAQDTDDDTDGQIGDGGTGDGSDDGIDSCTGGVIDGCSDDGGDQADTTPPIITVLNNADIASGQTANVSVLVEDASDILINAFIFGTCTAGVTGTDNDDDPPQQLFVLTAPEVTEDTPYSCPLSASDSAGNQGSGSIQGTIIAPTADEPDEALLRPYFGECLLSQSQTSCNYFAGGSQFCEQSQAAASCGYDPVLEVLNTTHFNPVEANGINRTIIPDDFRTFPQYSQNCWGVASNPNLELASETFLYECDAGSSGALVPPSALGNATVISNRDDQINFLYTVSTDLEGEVILIANLGADPDFAFDPDDDLLSFAGSGETSLTVPVFIRQNGDDAQPALFIQEGLGEQGLDSTIFIAEGYSELWTFLYIHELSENEDVDNPIIRGFVHVQSVEEGEATEGGFLLPLVDPDLSAFITVNDLVITEDIVISARNTVPFEGVFVVQDDGDSEGDGNGDGDGGSNDGDSDGPGDDPGAPTAGPPTVGGGVAIQIPPSSLVERSICPVPEDDTLTRCTAGADETLLVVNGNQEIAQYSSINGNFDTLFLDTEFHEIPVQDGWEATQAPDHCVLYTDNAGSVYLYDDIGTLINADGNGIAGGQGLELLDGSNNSISNYRGFDFHKAPDSEDWYLYLVEMTSFEDSGFINPRSMVVRYDYSLTGTEVLSNREVVITTDFTHFNDIMIVDDVMHVTSSNRAIPFGDAEDFSGGIVTRYDLLSDDLDMLDTYAFTSEFPAQISASYDDGVLLTNFGGESISLRERDPSLTTFDQARREYNLKQPSFLSGTGEVAGVYPLRNGDYLVSGDSVELNRSVVERVSGDLRSVPDNSSDIGRLIGRACL